MGDKKRYIQKKSRIVTYLSLEEMEDLNILFSIWKYKSGQKSFCKFLLGIVMRYVSSNRDLIDSYKDERRRVLSGGNGVS